MRREPALVSPPASQNLFEFTQDHGRCTPHHVAVDITRTETGARIEVTCEVEARTGVEMEAMTAASIGAVALYDMVKGVDRSAQISAVRLLAKSGGRSGEWTR